LTQSIEKYVRNAVNDVVNSQGVVVMNTITWYANHGNGGRHFEKNGKYKRLALVDKTHL